MRKKDIPMEAGSALQPRGEEGGEGEGAALTSQSRLAAAFLGPFLAAAAGPRGRARAPLSSTRDMAAAASRAAVATGPLAPPEEGGRWRLGSASRPAR